MANSGEGPLAWSAFVAMVLIWGSTFFAIRVSNAEGYEPFSAAFVRLLVAALALAALGLALRVPWPRGRELRVALAAGGLMFGANFGLLYWGELTVPSALAAVLWGVYPLLIAVGAAAFLQGDPLTRRGLLGGALAAVGLVAVFWSHLSLEAPVAGFAAILGGILAATAASLLLKGWGTAIHPVAFNAVAAATGAAVLAPVAFLVGDGAALPPSIPALLALLYLALVGGTAFLIWSWLLQRWPATRLSFQTVLSPVVAVVLGAVALAEPVEASFLVGTALVLAGTWLGVQRAKPPPTRPAEGSARSTE